MPMKMTLRTTADLICASVSRQWAAEREEPKDQRLGRPVLTPTSSNTQSGAAQSLHLSTLGCEENNTKSRKNAAFFNFSVNNTNNTSNLESLARVSNQVF